MTRDEEAAAVLERIRKHLHAYGLRVWEDEDGYLVEADSADEKPRWFHSIDALARYAETWR